MRALAASRGCRRSCYAFAGKLSRSLLFFSRAGSTSSLFGLVLPPLAPRLRLLAEVLAGHCPQRRPRGGSHRVLFAEQFDKVGDEDLRILPTRGDCYGPA